MNNKSYKKLFRYGIVMMSLIYIIILTHITFANPRVHWTYRGETNPDNWGELSSDFAICSTGQNQSPINFEDIITYKPVNLAFNYRNTPLNIVNNGHTVQVNYSPGSTVSINGKEYELIQFHFHTPSEHTINGEATALELHLVHKNKKGEIAVIGILIKPGQENLLIKKIWEKISSEKSEHYLHHVMINANDFIPQQHSHYHYIGSLTTPPCTEGVNWIVFNTPIEISEEQIATFTKIYELNARPVQPINQRLINF